MESVQDIHDGWFMEGGASIMIVAIMIQLCQYRGLHTHKVEELVAAISTTGYAKHSSITVQIRDGVYYLVDGLHRLTSVLQCIAMKVLPEDFQLKAVVFKQETPETVLIAYSAKVNEDNKMSAIMTFSDKIRWCAMFLQAILADFVEKHRERKTIRNKGEAPKPSQIALGSM